MNPLHLEMQERNARVLEAVFARADPMQFSQLGNEQRDSGSPCLYLCGSRVDHKYCFYSTNIGIVHCCIPESFPQTIVPAFHRDHDEIIAPTHGLVAVEYCTSLDQMASVVEVSLVPGEFVWLQRGWPHRLTVSHIRHARHEGAATAQYLSIKIGDLSDKRPIEDMSRWTVSHPLIERWKADQEWLDQGLGR